MKFLSKALKFILLLILLLVLLAVLTALSWYEGWPLFTGAAALLGIAALCLAARGAQLLWRWRNKRAFVSKMMSEQQAAAPESQEFKGWWLTSSGEVFSREQILSRVWGYDYFGDTRTVDAHIKRIRQKLPQENVPWTLKTVYGVGYRFEVNA